jgi:NADP-dependent 3-hydroxy acid dehydrogenase YdfG
VLGARDKGKLSTVADRINASGGKAIFTVTDVRDRNDLETLVAMAVEQGGQFDILINCAGIGPISRFDALDVEGWNAMIDVNLRGTLYGIAAALPVFARQSSGHMINIISTAGIKLVPTMGVYAATKNAVRTVTEILRQEAGPHLRVTEVSPGIVATDFSDSITDQRMKGMVGDQLNAIAIPSDAIARGVLYAIEQPAEVEISSIVIRPTAQG